MLSKTKTDNFKNTKTISMCRITQFMNKIFILKTSKYHYCFNSLLCQDIITVNVLPLTLLCHALLPDMAGRGRGALVNICSVAGLVAVPHLAVYSATQHYISALTRALATEYAGTGVVIQEVSPLSWTIFALFKTGQ